jgi:phosphoglycerate dehydrogenase-like enzyme
MTLLIALPDDDIRGRLAPEVGADVDLITWRVGDDAPARKIDLLVIPYVTNYEFLAELDPAHVGVVQGQALGYDGAAAALPDGVGFCNAVGVHEAPTAELALTLVLASQRGWPSIGVNQSAERWERPVFPGVIGRRVLLIGVGGIGREVENRLSGFGATLTRVARTARDDIHGIDEVPALLPAADIVILAVPLSDETRGLVDDAFLAALPDGALVVNVSRGPIVDTNALVDHVSRGRIRSALDVVDPEPLPAGHPLWSLPGSLISPHIGGNVQSMKDRIDPLVLRQIAHLRNGERPDHIVVPTSSTHISTSSIAGES